MGEEIHGRACQITSVRVPAAKRTASACKTYGLWPACVRLIPVSAWTYNPRCLDLWSEVLGLVGASRTIPPACRNALALRKADAELAQGERRPTARRATSDRQGCRGGQQGSA